MDNSFFWGGGLVKLVFGAYLTAIHVSLCMANGQVCLYLKQMYFSWVDCAEAVSTMCLCLAASA